MENVGARIKERRQKLGLSVEALAEKSKVYRSTLYRYEKGEIKKVSSEVMLSLADALSTTVDYLMGETDDPEEQLYTEKEWSMMKIVDDCTLLQRTLVYSGYEVQKTTSGVTARKGEFVVELDEERQVKIMQDIKRYLAFLLSE